MAPSKTTTIHVEKPTPGRLDEMKVKSWPIWEKEVSTFNWSYDETETCYLLAGRVKVQAGGETVEFGAGDLVTFPKGLRCTWNILEPVRKHYRFG